MATNPFIEALQKGRAFQQNPELMQATTGQEALPGQPMASDPVGFGTVLSGNVGPATAPQVPEGLTDALFGGGASMVPVPGMSPELFQTGPSQGGITLTELSSGRSAPLGSLEGSQIQQAGRERATGPVEQIDPSMVSTPQTPSFGSQLESAGIPQISPANLVPQLPPQAPQQPATQPQGAQLDPQGRMIPSGFATRAEAFPEFERESALREQRLSDTLESRAASRQDQRGGTQSGGMSDADARDLSKLRDPRASEGERARAMQVAERLGRDPLTGQPMADSMSERDRRVDSLMGTMGISRQQALGLVEGTTRVSRDPVTGEASIIDMVSGSSTPVTTEQMESSGMGEPGITDSEESQSLFNMAKESTGIWPTLKSTAQRVAGQVGVEVGDAPEIIQMRQNVQTAQQQLIRALSVNPRFPVAEQNRIREEVNITPSLFNDPVSLEAKMRGVDAGLRKRVNDEIAASKDESLPVAQRRDALRAANDIANFLDILGVPEESESEAAPTESSAPAGLSDAEWNVMTEEERKLFQ